MPRRCRNVLQRLLLDMCDCKALQYSGGGITCVNIKVNIKVNTVKYKESFHCQNLHLIYSISWISRYLVLSFSKQTCTTPRKWPR